MPTVAQFTVPVDDIERAKKFYTELFDWNFEKFPGAEFYDISTTALDGEEGIPGGMAMRQRPGETITSYIYVTSVDEYMAKVKKLGGKVVTPKITIPHTGYLAVCLDTEKNTFGIWESNVNAR